MTAECKRRDRVLYNNPGYTEIVTECSTHGGSGWMPKQNMCHTAYWDAWDGRTLLWPNAKVD